MIGIFAVSCRLASRYLESYAYFVLSYTLILFLSDEFGFTDEEAGWAYALLTALLPPGDRDLKFACTTLSGGVTFKKGLHGKHTTC